MGGKHGAPSSKRSENGVAAGPGASAAKSPIVAYDLKERKETTIVDDARGSELSADGRNSWYGAGAGSWFPQVEQAIAESLRLLDQKPPLQPKRPVYPNRTAPTTRAAGGGNQR